MKNKLMLGGNIFGHFTNPEETEAILKTARDLGIYSIDTADVYSEGKSEEIIGEKIKTDRSKWFLATKAGIKSHASPTGLGRKQNIIQKVEKSLKRLQTDYLDLYQMHHFDPETAIEETLEAFEELIEQGKILSGGVSNYAKEHLRALQASPKKVIKFHQMDLNVTNYHAQKGVVEACADQGISIVAYSSLVRGLFSEKYLSGSIPSESRAAISQRVRTDLTPDFLRRLQLTAEVCHRGQIVLPGFALQWLGRKKEVSWIIVGVRSSEQLLSLHNSLKQDCADTIFDVVEGIWN